MTAIELLALPPSSWERKLIDLSFEERNEIASSISHICERAALAKGYFDGRFLSDSGTHERGVKLGNAVRGTVRKALGFAYPKAGEFTF